MNNTPHLPNTALFCYGALALPLAFAGLPLYIHAPDFYASGAGLGLATIGTALLALRLIDAALDPVIGILSRRFAAHRTAIMTVAMVVMAVSFILLFMPSERHVLLWFCMCLATGMTAFSVLSINMNTAGSLWGAGAAEKTSIAGWREAMGLLGLLVAAALPAVIGFSAYTVVLTGLLAAAGFLFLLWHRRYAPLLRGREVSGVPWDWGKLRRRDSVLFFTIYFLSMLASAIPAVLVIFFIRDFLGAAGQTGLFLFIYFLTGATGMPLWLALSRRLGAPAAWLVAMGLACAVFIWAFSLSTGDVVSYGIICALSGLALGAELALPPAILSILIDRHGAEGQTSVHFSLLSFLSKIALAAGSFIAFALLGASAFVPAAANTATSLAVLGWTYALLPCVIKATAAGLLAFWIHLFSQGGNHAYSSHPNPYGGHNGA